MYHLNSKSSKKKERETIDTSRRKLLKELISEKFPETKHEFLNLRNPMETNKMNDNKITLRPFGNVQNTKN